MIVCTPTKSGRVLHGRECLGAQRNSDVVIARHETLAAALASNRHDYQLWVDDDIAPFSDAIVDEMIDVSRESGADVVTGWYPAADGSPMIQFSAGLIGPNTRWSEARACGFGFVLIAPRVWNYLAPPAVRRGRYRAGMAPAVFDHRYGWDSREYSEDFSFCDLVNTERLKVSQNGLRIVSANRVSLTHRGVTLSRNDILDHLSKFREVPPVETFVNRCGPRRDCAEMARQSVERSDLSNVRVLTEGSGNITRDWMSMLQNASLSRAGLVLMLEDDVAVCRDIESRLLHWESGPGLVYASPHFGAASLCRIGRDCGRSPRYGTQAVVTRPDVARQLLAAVRPLVADACAMANQDLWERVSAGKLRIFDNHFWDCLYASGLDALFPPRSWASHLGVGDSSWWGDPSTSFATPDFAEAPTLPPVRPPVGGLSRLLSLKGPQNDPRTSHHAAADRRPSGDPTLEFGTRPVHRWSLDPQAAEVGAAYPASGALRGSHRCDLAGAGGERRDPDRHPDAGRLNRSGDDWPVAHLQARDPGHCD